MTAVNAVEKAIGKEDKSFMRNDHLGYITVSPEDLGTGLRVSLLLRIPLVSAFV